MDEQEARAWVRDSFAVPRGTMERLDAFVDLLRDENQRQNLVSHASSNAIWSRHIADSAQLLRFAPDDHATWVDFGSGAGFPGLIVALLHRGPVRLVEERKLRAEFLQRAVLLLGLNGRAEVSATRVEKLKGAFDVISARAFAPLPRLLDLGLRLARPRTRWILPKGRNARSELEAAESLWQGDFQLEPSATDREAMIIVADNVRRKDKGRRG